MTIPIYEQEKRDGLEKAIAENTTIAYISQANLIIPSPQNLSIMKGIAGLKEDDDLYPIASVLASVGWNANDDVFDKTETIKARATPVNKPFNYMHNEADIIGHMTDSAIMDASGNVIENSVEITQIPDTFDVVVRSVLYKCWSDKDLQSRMDKIIAEIKENKWYVSMECLFPNFDYAVILPNGEQKVVARTKESAFLTKHLRAYKGTGKYEDYKIGRLLRNFAFSGKGLVDNPANKRSVIFENTNIFNGAKASVSILKGKRMDEVLKAQLDETKRKLDESLAENKTLQAKAKEEADKAVSTQITNLNATIAAKDEETKKAKKDKEDAEAAKTAAETALATEQDKIKVLTAEVTAMKAEAVKNGRISKLASAGVTGEDATKLIEKFASATEEMFDEIVALKAATKADKKDGDGDEPVKKDGKKDKEAKAEDISEDKNGEKAAAAAKVEDTKVPTDATLNPPPVVEDKAQALRATASAWIKENVLKNTKEKK